MKHEPPSLNEVDSLNLFLQKPGSFSKLGKLLEVAMMSDETKQTALPSSPTSVPSTYLRHANQQLHKVLTGRNSHWFSLLPRSPCDGSSLTDGPTTLPHSTSSSYSPQTSSGWVPCPSATSPAVSGPNSAASISNSSLMPLRVCIRLCVCLGKDLAALCFYLFFLFQDQFKAPKFWSNSDVIFMGLLTECFALVCRWSRACLWWICLSVHGPMGTFPPLGSPWPPFSVVCIHPLKSAETLTPSWTPGGAIPLHLLERIHCPHHHQLLRCLNIRITHYLILFLRVRLETHLHS